MTVKIIKNIIFRVNREELYGIISLKFFDRRDTMPEFGTPYSSLSINRKISNEELVRAIRFFIAAEYEAIQLYEELAETTDNKLAKEVLYDIANEEKVHAGEFLKLLKELYRDEEEFYKEGEKEVEDIKEKLGIK